MSSTGKRIYNVPLLAFLHLPLTAGDKENLHYYFSHGSAKSVIYR
jgi:hypothetical protein